MKYLKTIVCFSNSRKMAGRCIAGKEWRGGKPGAWVRPVSTRPTHEVSERERLYKDGYDPQPLDIIEIPCERYHPLSHQFENHAIDPHYYWQRAGRLAWQDIRRWLDHPYTLWRLGEESYAGFNNRVSVGWEDGTSLYLIAVTRLRLLVGHKSPYADSRRAVRGEFIYNSTAYRLDITDPVIERNYLTKADGQYDILHPVLCVSLGDAFQGHFYKLIAAVLYAERCE